jgi:hypothetical protein
VRISSRLRERYPEQMTIVLQYQYWDLKVSETGFEVGLSFADIPERLEIPFAAIRGFYDPSVNFELEFDVETVAAAPAEAPDAKAPEAVPDPKPARRGARPAGGRPAKPAKAETAVAGADEAGSDAKGAEVVSLDAFRKNK